MPSEAKVRASEKEPDNIDTVERMPTVAAVKKKQKQAHFDVVAAAKWNSALQHDFDSDLCKLIAATHSSWNWANNPQTFKFFAKWIPSATVKDAAKLSGMVLDKEVEKVRERMKIAVRGKYGTGQQDGVKNIARDSIMATSVTVEGVVSSCNLVYVVKADMLLGLSSQCAQCDC
jgi:hypothetical protein